MPSTLNIQDILSQVKKLDKDDQLTLLERIAALVRKDSEREWSSKLSSISGLGSEIWKKTNIDEYLDQERRW